MGKFFVSFLFFSSPTAPRILWTAKKYRDGDFFVVVVAVWLGFVFIGSGADYIVMQQGYAFVLVRFSHPV